MAKILVSVPVLGRPNLRMIQSLYSAINSCKDHDISIYTSENDSMISRVRNVHLSVFMNDYKDYDYFVSIDSDLEILNRYSSNNIFTKLVSHDKEFVGGLYALKNDKDKICASVPMDRNRKPAFDDGLKEMLWLSTGCWCLHRSAVQKMIDEYHYLTYDGDDNMSDKKIYGLYLPMIKPLRIGSNEKKKLLSEDWSFCSRWKDIGGNIFADTSIVLNHYGEKSFPLWDVEVIAKKKINTNQESNTKIKKEIKKMPKPGFDLGEN